MTAKVTCAICHTPIKAAYTAGKCVSWGWVILHGALQPVHHACYYGKRTIDDD
jgi:hypothetical protein